MHWFDFVVFAILVFAVVRGFMSGFIMQIAYLAALVVGAIFAGVISGFILPFFEFSSESMHYAHPITFIIAFILICVAIVLAGRIFTEVLKTVKLNLPNRLAGSIFCVAKYLFLLSLTVNITAQFSDLQKGVITEDDNGIEKKSLTYSSLKKVVPAIIPYFSIVQDNIR